MIQRIKDWLLERRIDAFVKQTRYEKRADWEEFSRLIQSRSPQQIARMERQKGLV